jgi:putative ABC transport system permease protein
MTFRDLAEFLLETLRAQKLRSFLTLLGITVGMTAVVLLSSLGEGAKRGIAAEFSEFGTTIVSVSPGKRTTFGVSPGAIGGTTRPLTVEDAESLRRLRGVVHVSSRVGGMAEAEAGGRSRKTYVTGTVWEDQWILKWRPRIGTFLPPGDTKQAPLVCVVGSKVAAELFPSANPLGAHLRVGGIRFTVVGVMESKGQVLGFDLDDMVYLPVRRAMKLFNREGLMEIHVLAANPAMIEPVLNEVRRALRERHDGEEDFTLATQADMLGVVDEIIDVLTLGVMVIAAVSLLVGAMGILTILWVSVHERTAEIGLIKAVGAGNGQILSLFLAEGAVLAALGGGLGVVIGAGGAWVARRFIPGLWIDTPVWIIPTALAVSLVVGAAAGFLPARKASRLDPIEALRAE